jgi:hypothetical protein
MSVAEVFEGSTNPPTSLVPVIAKNAATSTILQSTQLAFCPPFETVTSLQFCLFGTIGFMRIFFLADKEGLDGPFAAVPLCRRQIRSCSKHAGTGKDASRRADPWSVRTGEVRDLYSRAWLS